MQKNIRRELLSWFGAVFVTTRHQAIGNILNLASGKYQDRVSLSIAAQIKDLSPQQHKAVSEMVMEAVDTTLIAFLTFLSENEALDLTISKDGKNYSIREVSDDLGAA